ncbi:MAG: hypothetical protein JSS78_02750 [Bacteroidetes bacterium]|nr:hypothetical protein [Bacteroidota bacterium]
MQQDLIQKLHQDKYQSTMSADQYSASVQSGFDSLLQNGFESTSCNNRESVNMALEYNEELMLNLLRSL